VSAKRVVVRGRVQGVGFRFATLDEAASLGVTGWVRNRRDGSVEAWLQGSDEAVARVVEWCRAGPRAARVDGIEVHDEADAPELRGFTQRPTA
jgi:acylphosphatase